MSAEGDQQRRPGAPDDTDGKRRLRTVSYPDPFLVTKLPLEGTVNSGVIRLGERMLLGFIHRPFPDGTRVRVVYDEWLFAERLDDEHDEENGAGEENSAEQISREPEVRKSAQVEKGRSTESSAEEELLEGGGTEARKEGGRPGRTEGARPAKPGGESGNRKKGGTGKGHAQAGPSDEARDEGSGKRFPDDFNDPRPSSELDGQGDAWTDAFSRREHDD